MNEPTAAGTSVLANIRHLAAQFAAAPNLPSSYTPLWVALASVDLSALLVEFPDGRIPATHEHLIALGNHSFREGRYDQAVDFYAHAMRLQPEWPFAAGALAYVFSTQGRHAEADAMFRQVAARYQWPYGNLRLGAEFWAELKTVETETFDIEIAFPGDHAGRAWQALIAVDSRYLERYAPALADSFLRHHGNDAGLHIHVVNPTDAARELARRLSESSNGRVAVSVETKDLGEDLVATCDRIRERRSYFACARFLIAPQLLRRYRVPLAIIDADLVVRHRFDELVTTGDWDVALTRFPINGQILWQQYFASFQVWRPSVGGHAYAELLAKYLRYFLDRERWIWPLDQAALYSLGEFVRDGAQGAALRIQHYAPDIVTGGKYFQNLVGSMTGRHS